MPWSHRYHVDRRSFRSQSNGRSFWLAVVDTNRGSAWDLVQLRVRLGPMEKIPYRGDGHIWRRTAERPAGTCYLLC